MLASSFTCDETFHFHCRDLSVVVGVIARERLGGFANDFVSADDLVLIKIDLMGMSRNGFQGPSAVSRPFGAPV